jgi:hypothetical protein
MKNVISESTYNMLVPQEKNGIEIFSEGCLIPLNKNDVKDFLNDSSRNIRNLTEHFELDRKKARFVINEDRKSIDIVQENITLRVFLEDFISDEIDNYLLNKF